MHNIIKGITRHICFRLVDIDDAEFVLSLRLDMGKSRFISHVDKDVDAQKRWIADYKKREAERTEYYYIIENHAAERLGTIRLYDFQGDSFCWGSWVLKNGVPYYVAVESSLLAYEIGFYLLGFNKAHGDVRKGNDSVLDYHLRFGGVITREDDLNYYLGYTKEKYELVKQKYKRFFVADI